MKRKADKAGKGRQLANNRAPGFSGSVQERGFSRVERNDAYHAASRPDPGWWWW